MHVQQAAKFYHLLEKKFTVEGSLQLSVCKTQKQKNKIRWSLFCFVKAEMIKQNLTKVFIFSFFRYYISKRKISKTKTQKIDLVFHNFIILLFNFSFLKMEIQINDRFSVYKKGKNEWVFCQYSVFPFSVLKTEKRNIWMYLDSLPYRFLFISSLSRSW